MSLALNSVTGIPSFNDFLTSFHPNPAVLIVIGVIIVFFVAVFAVKGTGGTETGKATTSGLTVLLAGLFVVLLLMNGMAYFFNFNVTTGLTNLFSPTPEVVVQAKGSSVGNCDETQATASGDGDSGGNETTVPEIKITPQVFHVPGNKYGFRDAQAICAVSGTAVDSLRYRRCRRPTRTEPVGAVTGGQMAKWPYSLLNRRNGRLFKRYLDTSTIAVVQESMVDTSRIPTCVSG